MRGEQAIDMKRNLSSRLNKLELLLRPGRNEPGGGLRIGVVVKHLPDDYVGEHHLAPVHRNPKGYYEMEMRPGPAPRGHDQGFQWVIMTEFEFDA